MRISSTTCIGYLQSDDAPQQVYAATLERRARRLMLADGWDPTATIGTSDKDPDPCEIDMFHRDTGTFYDELRQKQIQRGNHAHGNIIRRNALGFSRIAAEVLSRRRSQWLLTLPN